MTKKFVIILYHEFDTSMNMSLRNIALQTEDTVKADGYTVVLGDNDAFLTWVQFDNEADMVVFRLKYMTYKLAMPDWMKAYYIG